MFLTNWPVPVYHWVSRTEQTGLGRAEAPPTPTKGPTHLVSSGLRTPSGFSLPTPVPLRAALSITAVAGPHDGATWELVQPKVTIGRIQNNDVCLHRDSGVSRLHLTLSFVEGRWYVRDDHSSNGTYLCIAGQLFRINSMSELPVGARLRVGSTELRIGILA